jgi:hypothetical protein
MVEAEVDMDPVQIELLREAIRGVCAVCGTDLGLRQVPDGGRVPMTCCGVGGFQVCELHENSPLKLPDGSILAA